MNMYDRGTAFLTCKTSISIGSPWNLVSWKHTDSEEFITEGTEANSLGT